MSEIIYKQVDSIKKLEQTDKSLPDRYEFVITSEAIDRSNDKVILAGLDTTAFQKNPVIFYNHDTWALPIGRSIALYDTVIDGIKSRVSMFEFDVNDEFAQAVKSKVDGGFLNAASIGFAVHSQEQMKLNPEEQSKYPDMRSYNAFTKSELYEFSIVSIPANQTATRIKLNNSAELKNYYAKAGRVLSAANFDKLQTIAELANAILDSATTEASASASADLSTTKGVNPMSTEETIDKGIPTADTANATQKALEEIQAKNKELETKLFDMERKTAGNLGISEPNYTPSEEAEHKLLAFGGILKAKGNIKLAKTMYSDNNRIMKQLDTLSGASGGYLVSEAPMGAMLPYYYNDSILSQLKTTNVPMTRYEQSYPRSSALSSPKFKGKYQKSEAGTVTISKLVLKAFDFKQHFVIGNDLLDYSEIDIVNWLKAELTMYVPTWIDDKFLWADGSTVDTPIGIYNQILPANKVAMTGSPTVSTVKADLLAAQKRVKASGVRVNQDSGVYLMSETVKYYILSLTESGGQTPEWARTLTNPVPTLWGYKVITSNTIPDTIVLFGDPRYIYYGTRQPLSMEFVFNGSWADDNGTYIGRSLNQSPIFVDGSFGQLLTYTSAFSAITGVTWGS